MMAEKEEAEADLLAVICVSSGRDNVQRRRACRNTWFRYVTDPGSPLPLAVRARLRLRFLVSSSPAAAAGAAAPASGAAAPAAPGPSSADVEEEAAQHGDVMLLDAREGYEHLWRKALVALRELDREFAARGRAAAYFVHADDDSLLRLDLLVPLLEAAPRERFYWGYIWDGAGNRVTAPIRNPRNKSYMPADQYPLDHYPPFASGCCFALSWDLVAALLAQPLPDYRLLDPPFGIHLCGGERCVLAEPVVPVHDERVRPYRGIPVFHPSTITQHYLRPEEMKPFYLQALEDAKQRDKQQQQQQQIGGDGGDGGSAAGGEQQGAATVVNPAADLYSQLVAMGLLRR